MTIRKASAQSIRQRITRYVKTAGNLLPSEIYIKMSTLFPNNNDYEFRAVVKEMQKDKLLIPDIIYGGLTLPNS